MTLKLAEELDAVLNKAKLNGSVGTVIKGRSSDDDREILMCQYIEQRYGLIERKGYSFVLTGLGVIEMEANNDAPFLNTYELEMKKPGKDLVVKVFKNGWELVLAIVSSGFLMELFRRLLDKLF